MRRYFSRGGFIINMALLYGMSVVFTRTRYEYHLLKTNITAKQYYSRASVNITAPQGARKRCLRRKHSSKLGAVRMLSLRQNKRSVFFRTCAGKRHLKSRECGDRKGANGGKREGERSEQESVVPRLNLSLRQNKNRLFPDMRREKTP